MAVATTVSRRDRIVLATIDIILERGSKSITLAEILEASKVSRATLYRHFSGRDAILEGVFELLVQRTLDDLSAALAAESDIDCRVNVVFGWLDRMLRSGIVGRLLETDVELMMELIRRVNEGVWPMFDQALSPVFDRAENLLGLKTDRALVTEIIRRVHVSFGLFPSPRSIAEPGQILKDVFKALLVGLVPAAGVGMPLPKAASFQAR